MNYLDNQSDDVKQKWSQVYSHFGGGSSGLYAANTWLLNNYEPVQQVRETVQFSVDSSQGFLKRDDSGEEYITLVLSTEDEHKDGKKYTPELLQKWAEMINQNGIIGDIDHDLYNKLLSSTMTDEQVKLTLKNKPGIAKALKAIYEKGKLYVRALIDKRYRNIIQKAKGVSAEAFVDYGPDGKTVTGGELLGFTFNVNTTPADNGVVML